MTWLTWLRALAAAGLSVVMPGAGHALIRDWIRALIFSGLFLSAFVVLLPAEQIAAADTVTDGMDVVTEETTTLRRFVLMFIVLFATIDATFRAMGFPPNAADTGDGPTCPECGKELDEDLTFCHWCTTRLESPAVDEREDEPTRS
ncbi:zinc ribbon domain-containing protein [Halosolutus halophilus]|uniref:zinc ribbon domain-containing protein n=1 Tax=Halosolutus halophilus TaxID=1552990 RepID=UPI002234FAC1|nr:zinc ribbon domain-containing protein [Halosolutus halophilus]